MNTKRNLTACLLATLLASPACALCKDQIKAPTQPKTGPGGSNYVHKSHIGSTTNKDQDQYWIFQPDQPRVKKAPVILFLHGWGATSPTIYGAWIDHLIRRGNIVIFPRYQKNLFSSMKDVTANSLKATKAALKELASDKSNTQPDLEKFAIVGHSIGGVLTANVAALAKENGLPTPKAIMSIAPGITRKRGKITGVPLADMKKINQNTLMLVVVAQKDLITGQKDAKRIFKEATNVKPANKNYVLFLPDNRGKPSLPAHHNGTVAIKELTVHKTKNGADANDGLKTVIAKKLIHSIDGPSVNAHDWYGYWKLFDGLTNAAFYNKDRKYALGDTPEQRFLGKWSDGSRITEIKVVAKP